MKRAVSIVSCWMAVLVLLAAGCGGPSEPPVKEVDQPEPPSPAPVAREEAAPALPAAHEATIYRDSWGVPHIYAKTDADAAYALGYAQAQDRLADIHTNARTAAGTMAEAFGPQFVEQDYIMKLVKNAERCEAYWATAPGPMKAVLGSFIAGIRAYEAEHPEARPEWAVDLQPWHCVAIGRAMILRWPLGDIFDDLKSKKEAPGFGSNGWAVAPSRSAEGCPILLTDPHLSWEGLAVFYEARVHGAELHMNGYFLAGTPVIALGHNGHVGWACTTGSPDTGDVYQIKLNPQNPMQYEYDGEWRTAEVSMITIDVKGEEPKQRMAAYTHLGPMVAEPDLKNGVAFVGATPYLEAVGVIDQMYRMGVAKNCDAFYEALGMHQLMGQNVLFADCEGNIQYVRSGATPIRPDGYDWGAPVPGNTSATAWLGIHDIRDLVQVKNPPQGLFTNCNNSPEVMMKDSPMTPDKYKDYLFNVSWDYSNPRGRRSLELLESDDSITKEEAMAIAMDVYDALSKPWQGALKAAVDAVGAEKMKDPDFAAAVEAILAWNGEVTADSVGTPIYKVWRLKLPGKVDVATVGKGGALKAEDQETLLVLLSETLTELKTQYGRLDLTWGDIHKVGRSGKLFPCPGADFGGNSHGPNFTETLFDVRSKETPKGSGVHVGNNGSMAMMLMFMHKDGIEAYTCTPWGQSADPESPHHMDQGEKLYSNREFKPTWFAREELADHVESTEVLSIQ
jgi:acyl-homoserine-lactone acylase